MPKVDTDARSISPNESSTYIPSAEPTPPPAFFEAQDGEPTAVPEESYLNPASFFSDDTSSSQATTLSSSSSSSSATADDVNAKNHLGDVSLHAAIRKGERSRVSMLLAHPNINVNIVGLNGDTALHLATKQGTFVDLLLRKPDININASNDENNTPLFDALKLGDLTSARQLIDRGAYVNVANNAGLTPVHIAIGTMRRVPLDVIIAGIQSQAKGTEHAPSIARLLERVGTIKASDETDWHRNLAVQGILLAATALLPTTSKQASINISAEQRQAMRTVLSSTELRVIDSVVPGSAGENFVGSLFSAATSLFERARSMSETTTSSPQPDGP
jgi:hypothetical protein